MWPGAGFSFRGGMVLKLKIAAGAETNIAVVRYYADSTLIYTSTNFPFNGVWATDNLPSYGVAVLRAIGETSSGIQLTSAPVTVNYFSGAPPSPVVKILGIGDGDIFPTGKQMTIRAELLASAGDAAPMPFYLDGAFVARSQNFGLLSATNGPADFEVPGISNGVHRIEIKYEGFNGGYCSCDMLTIRVADLGINSPAIGSNGDLSFKVVTAADSRSVIVQSSSDLSSWVSISTNSPSAVPFLFSVGARSIKEQFFRLKWGDQ